MDSLNVRLRNGPAAVLKEQIQTAIRTLNVDVAEGDAVESGIEQACGSGREGGGKRRVEGSEDVPGVGVS